MQWKFSESTIAKFYGWKIASRTPYFDIPFSYICTLSKIDGCGSKTPSVFFSPRVCQFLLVGALVITKNPDHYSIQFVFFFKKRMIHRVYDVCSLFTPLILEFSRPLEFNKNQHFSMVNEKRNNFSVKAIIFVKAKSRTSCKKLLSGLKVFLDYHLHKLFSKKTNKKGNVYGTKFCEKKDVIILNFLSERPTFPKNVDKEISTLPEYFMG